MNTFQLLLKGASEVLFAGLIFGAGLPFVYAVALRVMTIGSTTYADPSGEIHSTPRMSSRLFAGLLIAVVVAGSRHRADDHRGDRLRQGSHLRHHLPDDHRQVGVHRP